MSYQIGLDLGASRTVVATGHHVTTAAKTAPGQAEEAVHVIAELERLHGEPPSRVALAHPLTWGHEQLEHLRAQLIDAGRPDVLFVPEPHAAVTAFDEVANLHDDSTVAVFDFGDTKCDIAVLRKCGVFLTVGRPERVEFGGRDVDDLVVEHVAAKAKCPPQRRSCREAKELLSTYPEVRIPVVARQDLADVRLSRLEFEAIVRPAVEYAVDALVRVMKTSRTAPDVVLLVGGSARIPLVAKEISERILTPLLRAPEGAVALGAAIEAHSLEPEPVQDTQTVLLPVSDEEPARKRRHITPFVAAGLIAVAVACGFATHQALDRDDVRRVVVEETPPGLAVLPRMNG